MNPSDAKRTKVNHLDMWGAWFAGGLRRELLARIVAADEKELPHLQRLLSLKATPTVTDEMPLFDAHHKPVTDD